MKATKYNKRGQATEWLVNGVAIRRTRSGELSEAFTREKYCTVDGKWMGRTLAEVARLAS